MLQALVRAGETGLRFGDIQTRTGIAASTLAHHLKFLSAANLIIQRKEGRTIWTTANYQYLGSLASFILENCCTEAGSGS